MLPGKILDILCCPKCLGKLIYDGEKETLTCKKCDDVYPVKNSIPNLIINEQLRKKSNANR